MRQQQILFLFFLGFQCSKIVLLSYFGEQWGNTQPKARAGNHEAESAGNSVMDEKRGKSLGRAICIYIRLANTTHVLPDRFILGGFNDHGAEQLFFKF